MSTYEIIKLADFDRLLKKLICNNPGLGKNVSKTIISLSEHPFYPSLHTHRVNTKKFGQVFSSRVTADIRIIWIFHNEKPAILALSIGGHSGKKAVY